MHVTPGVYWQDKSTVLCTIGGFLIGIVCSSRMAVCGKVTGISGIFNTITRFELTASMRALNDIKEANLTMDFEKFTRVCYIGGMLVSRYCRLFPNHLSHHVLLTVWRSVAERILSIGDSRLECHPVSSFTHRRIFGRIWINHGRRMYERSWDLRHRCATTSFLRRHGNVHDRRDGHVDVC